MKKVLLTAMALFTIIASSAFGYYGGNNDWIDFLTDANQLRFRTRQMGLVLGNGAIKGVIGVRDESETALGQILSQGKFIPTLSLGIGYTTDAFGIGIGYNYDYTDEFRGATKSKYNLSVHTPVIAMNFLNNNLRIVVPVQVGVLNFDTTGVPDILNPKYLGISLDPQIRYYTGIEAFSELRLTIKYGMNQVSYKDNGVNKTYTASSLGFDFRAYFGAQVGDVGLKPFIKITYDTSLDATKTGLGEIGITAGSGITPPTDVADKYISNPWELNVLPTLGLSANSDIVSVYAEGGLGYKAYSSGLKYANKITHTLSWAAYGEISITPVKDLEWYFEAEIASPKAQQIEDKVKFNAATGVTWYLPSFQ
ncbi:cell surface protein [Brachyspira sp.]|uniref:cell surface protein n=1 Tax=Brachyspira sp. TaxID=1977261 RepID=UPI0026034550|nr:cell surface protein [Brachyspira sp.]